MKNYVQPGEVLTVAAPYDVSSGGGAKVGLIFGIAAEDATSGSDVDLAVEGVFSVTKLSTDAFAVGDAVYWDDTNKRCTSTTTSNTKIGVAVVAAANPSSTVTVRLNESF